MPSWGCFHFSADRRLQIVIEYPFETRSFNSGEGWMSYVDEGDYRNYRDAGHEYIGRVPLSSISRPPRRCGLCSTG